MINRRQNNFIIIELLRDYILEQKLSSAILDYFKNPNFLCKVRWFNLSPLMFEILKESELPESVYLTLQKDYEITLCRNLRALHSLGILFESLENENIKTVNLRGLDLQDAAG